MDNPEMNTEHDSLLTQFINITGADETIAKNALEACEWDVGMAINMFVDSNLAQQTKQTSSASGPSALTALSSSLSAAGPSIDSTFNTSSRNRMEQSNPVNSDEVRPPIPPIRQILVEDYPRNMYANSGYDGFRNFEQESRWQEQQLSEESETQSTSTENKRRTFDDLFRPPLDLIFRGTFEMAKLEGQRANKWLLVNIQNPQEFSCQVLNRDVWSNSTVKAIINEHFIFWQTYHDSTQGQNFISFYNVHSFPYISIIDPRTGEKIISWHELDTVTFCEKVTQFLNEHPSPSGKQNRRHSNDNQGNPGSSSSSIQHFEKTPYDESEQMQIEAAIKASLQDMEDYNNKDTEESINQQQNSSSNDSWRNYLGTDDSNKIEIVIRYPDGNKEKVMFPSNSKLKALFLYVTEHGYSMKEYDLITNFPKKNLKTTCDENETLENAGIHSRDTLYVQTKN